MSKVTKAVIAAAGFGTRFLPQTKAMPKEMLPIIDKPIIQYIVEDLVEAGIKDIIIVGSSNKRAIKIILMCRARICWLTYGPAVRKSSIISMKLRLSPGWLILCTSGKKAPTAMPRPL